MLLVVEEMVRLCANPVQPKQIKKRVKNIFMGYIESKIRKSILKCFRFRTIQTIYLKISEGKVLYKTSIL